MKMLIQKDNAYKLVLLFTLFVYGLTYGWFMKEATTYFVGIRSGWDYFTGSAFLAVMFITPASLILQPFLANWYDREGFKITGLIIVLSGLVLVFAFKFGFESDIKFVIGVGCFALSIFGGFYSLALAELCRCVVRVARIKWIVISQLLVLLGIAISAKIFLIILMLIISGILLYLSPSSAKPLERNHSGVVESLSRLIMTRKYIQALLFWVLLIFLSHGVTLYFFAALKVALISSGVGSLSFFVCYAIGLIIAGICGRQDGLKRKINGFMCLLMIAAIVPIFSVQLPMQTIICACLFALALGYIFAVQLVFLVNTCPGKILGLGMTVNIIAYGCAQGVAGLLIMTSGYESIPLKFLFLLVSCVLVIYNWRNCR